MASLIPGYEYDIFISYRQKDNKGDKWVSEFVEALKTELESTFKEEISVYFDINPSDYLLESYDVDASLKDKLKCLVFIPIISRTYCDSKSFAWEHEFKAFVELASHDQFGLKIKLSNGNVASRVLPVRIHDLDIADVRLCEEVIGGVLRTVDFVFKTASGVNRPLKSKEDHQGDNLNKTYYQDQINKVALATREIITSFAQNKPEKEEASKEVIRLIPVSQKQSRTKIIAGTIIALILIILGIVLIPKLFKSPKSLEKTIAVLPFRNLTNDSTQLYFCDGFMEEILNNLQKINSFTVRSRTSSDLYRGTKKSITVIGNELNVNYLIEGSVGWEENIIKIWVQLIDTKADKHIWSNDYNRELKQVLVLQSEIAKDIALELKTILSPEEKELIEKNQKVNLEAYDLYMKGRYFWNKRGEANLKLSKEYFEKALAIDRDYALAISGLADYYYIQVVNNYLSPSEGFPKAKELALKAAALDKDIAEPHVTLGNILYWSDMKWEEARKEYLSALKLNSNYSETYYNYAQLLNVLRENNEARIQINHAIELNPFQANYHYWSGSFYYNEGKFNESLKEFLKVLELNPESKSTHHQCFRAYFRLGDSLNALESFQKHIRRNFDTLALEYVKMAEEIYDSSGIEGILNTLIESSPNSYYSNATNYAMLGKKVFALECLEKAFEYSPYAFFRINNDYDFSSLHSEPRFQAIIKKMGLSEYQTPK